MNKHRKPRQNRTAAPSVTAALLARLPSEHALKRATAWLRSATAWLRSATAWLRSAAALVSSVAVLRGAVIGLVAVLAHTEAPPSPQPHAPRHSQEGTRLEVVTPRAL